MTGIRDLSLGLLAYINILNNYTNPCIHVKVLIDETETLRGGRDGFAMEGIPAGWECVLRTGMDYTTMEQSRFQHDVVLSNPKDSLKRKRGLLDTAPF